jgi:hypothetical protein
MTFSEHDGIASGSLSLSRDLEEFKLWWRQR